MSASAKRCSTEGMISTCKYHSIYEKGDGEGGAQVIKNIYHHYETLIFYSTFGSLYNVCTESSNG